MSKPTQQDRERAKHFAEVFLSDAEEMNVSEAIVTVARCYLALLAEREAGGRFEKLANDGKADLPVGYEAPLDTRTTRELIADRSNALDAMTRDYASGRRAGLLELAKELEAKAALRADTEAFLESEKQTISPASAGLREAAAHARLVAERRVG